MMLAMHSTAAVTEIGSKLLGWQVSSAMPVRGGGNNRIFRLTGAGGAAALKFYPLQHEDPRDRLGQEYSALTFLHGQGIGDVPRPIAGDAAARCAAYEWIDGTPPSVAGEAEVDALADFFVRLQELRKRQGADRLADASASCFSPAMMVGQLQQRLARIREVVAPGSDLSDFLQEVIPKSATVIRRLREQCNRAGIYFDSHLPRSQQALSPSDFGLHNALRRADGRLAFLDFEYFGWDDPAKAIADVMYHPGTTLSTDLAQRYRSRVEAALAVSDPGLPIRLDLLLPVIGLMWCVMLLNEFLPERWARRALSDQTTGHSEAKARQLGKARHLFHRIAL